MVSTIGKDCQENSVCLGATITVFSRVRLFAATQPKSDIEKRRGQIFRFWSHPNENRNKSEWMTAKSQFLKANLTAVLKARSQTQV
jgi:hypothetical protein